MDSEIKTLIKLYFKTVVKAAFKELLEEEYPEFFVETEPIAEDDIRKDLDMEDPQPEKDTGPSEDGKKIRRCGLCGQGGHRRDNCKERDQGKPDDNEFMFGYSFEEADKMIDEYEELEGDSRKLKFIADTGLSKPQFFSLKIEVAKRWKENT